MGLWLIVYGSAFSSVLIPRMDGSVFLHFSTLDDQVK